MRKNLLLAMTSGFLLGAAWLIAVRFLAYQPVDTHYHANFALYVNSQRHLFNNFSFYEEVQACSDHDSVDPKARVHMHNNTNHVVHVHDQPVTWGDFFANLGYGMTNNALETDEGVYVDGVDGNELTFILNGKAARSIANRPIGNKDRLLVNYGLDHEPIIEKRYEQIPSDAEKYNLQNDPGGCSGSAQPTFAERLKHAVGLQ